MNIDLIKQHIKNSKISCTSMVVTVFGDTVSQHGHWIWLSSLIQSLEPFGFNERQVRTSVYRLVQSNWLQVKKVGRCSYYAYTDFATGHYEKAARRIYAQGLSTWDHTWTLVLPVSVPENKKEEFRKSLFWLGFNTLSSALYTHPSSERTSLDELIKEQDLVNDVVILNAKTDDENSYAVIKALVKSRWKLSDLESYYQEFLDFYQPIYQSITAKLPDLSVCFLLRSTMIHDFRRILLRDPDFPSEMLPESWVGHEVHALVNKSYKLLSRDSLAYIQQNMKNEQGRVPAASSNFQTRFAD